MAKGVGYNEISHARWLSIDAQFFCFFQRLLGIDRIFRPSLVFSDFEVAV
jgi:hypothetical protein